MEQYSPPFTITNKMLERVSTISEKIGKINNTCGMDSRPRLRRNNRIMSIHSSLKIEANSLSLDQVRDVIDGQFVLGSKKEIQEVKNAYNAYSDIAQINVYSIEELLERHRIMTGSLVKESGVFRSGEEGVFNGSQCIFMAPPAKLVPSLMEQLFEWMSSQKDRVHPLILSSVFHDEFVFIHPFSDGNGRMARLWHSAILSKWKPVFEYIPLESQIERFQEGYYHAIAECHRQGNSDYFIEFMLEQTDSVLESVLDQLKRTETKIERLLTLLEDDRSYSANEMMALMGKRSKDSFRKHFLNPAIEQGYLQMTVPDKPNSKNQRYKKTK